MKQWILWMILGSMLMATDAGKAARMLGAQSDFKTAMTQAKSEHKMVAMVIVKEHCRWCEKLVRRTLDDAQVKAQLAKDYVLLIVDKDASYPADFKENFFPSIFYIDEKTGKSVYENVGYVGTKCFLNDLQSALKMRNDLYNN
ncbi:MAG: DUF255 domain-containing protein [Sulfurovum sp.]|nr:DUF255 domain-containing protein [Sulfurovum sp.]